MTVFDVSIVGAGPAGAALATHLARDGYSVLLLERGRFPRDKVCGDLVSAKGLKMLAELGCYAEIERGRYQPLRTASAYLEDELLVTAPLPTLPDHPPFGHTIPRLQLDEMIFRRAVAAGAHAVESCSVVDYNVDRSLVTIAAEVEGQRRAFVSRVIVGADGAGSVVARRAGLEMRDPRHVQLAMRSYCRGLRLDAPIIFFTEEFFPGYGWAFPVNDVLVNIGVGMVKESAQRDHLTLKRFYARFLEFVRRKALEAGVAIELTPARRVADQDLRRRKAQLLRTRSVDRRCRLLRRSDIRRRNSARATECEHCSRNDSRRLRRGRVRTANDVPV